MHFFALVSAKDFVRVGRMSDISDEEADFKWGQNKAEFFLKASVPAVILKLEKFRVSPYRAK